MIMGIIGAVGGLASAGYGAWQQAKAAKRAEELQAEQKAANNAWYMRNYYQDYLNTAQAQNALRKVRNEYAERTKEARARQAITGGTAEQAQAVAEAGAEAYGNVVGDIAAQGEQDRQAIDAQKLAMDANLNQQQMAIEDSRQQAGASLINSGIGVATSSLQGIDWKKEGAEKKPLNL